MERILALLKMTLPYQRPKVIVLDVDQYWKSNSFEEKPSHWHYTFDYYPLSFEKICQVVKLAPTKKVAWELLFDLYRYHVRYKDLKPEDFGRPFDDDMGMHMHYESEPQDYYTPLPSDVEISSYKNDTQCVRDILDLCLENKIQVLLTCYPYSADPDHQKYYLAIGKLAEEYGVPYLDFLAKESWINWKVDMQDGGHLNYLGAKKITSALGAELANRFALQDHRADKGENSKWLQRVANWERDLQKTTVHEEVEDCMSALVCSATRAFDMTCFVHPVSKEKGRAYPILFEAMTGFGLPLLNEAINQDEPYYIHFDKENAAITEYMGQEAERQIELEYGEVPKMWVCLTNPESKEHLAEFDE